MALRSGFDQLVLCLLSCKGSVKDGGVVRVVLGLINRPSAYHLDWSGSAKEGGVVRTALGLINRCLHDCSHSVRDEGMVGAVLQL